MNNRKCNPEDFNITSYSINSDNSIDITQDVNMEGCELSEIPFKIRELSGKINLSNNNLISLKNAPKSCLEMNISYNPISFIDKENMEISTLFTANETKLVNLENLPKCERIYIMNCQIVDTSFLNKMKDFTFSYIQLNKNQIKHFLHPELISSKVLSLSFNPIESFDVSNQCGLIRMEENKLSYERLKYLVSQKFKIESWDNMLAEKEEDYKIKIILDNL